MADMMDEPTSRCGLYEFYHSLYQRVVIRRSAPGAFCGMIRSFPTTRDCIIPVSAERRRARRVARYERDVTRVTVGAICSQLAAGGRRPKQWQSDRSTRRVNCCHSQLTCRGVVHPASRTTVRGIDSCAYCQWVISSDKRLIF